MMSTFTRLRQFFSWKTPLFSIEVYEESVNNDDDDEYCHIFCCTDTTAICGRGGYDEDDEWCDDECDHEPCKLCELVNNFPCRNPECKRKDE